MKVSAVLVVCLGIALGEPHVPVAQYILTPSAQYGTPATQYGVPNDYTVTLVPTEQYGAPNLQYNFQVGVPKPAYGVPTIPNNAISGNYYEGTKPSSQYGVSQTTNHFTPSINQNSKYKYAVSTSNSVHSTLNKSKPQNQYNTYNLASAEGNHLDKYEANDEPANYDFKYYVQDNEGNEFGHEEGREGDVANGRYHVLLPDGKLQTVEYTADAEGYKPRISYEQVGSGYPVDGGYEQGNVKHGGYSR